VAHLQEKDHRIRAYNQAVRYLGPRMRSCHETRRHLRSKGVPMPVVDQVVTRLTEEGYLDDRHYAAALIAERSRRSPRGALGLKNDLRHRGIDDQTAIEALATLDEMPLAMAALEKKMRSLQAPDARTLFVKAMRFLKGRGFDYQTAKTAFRRWEEKQDDDHDGTPQPNGG
jgi:regulatory protein